jgi:ATP-binding cassette subfamily B protein
MMLFGFLFRNLRGYRLLVFIAIILTFAQVASDIAVALPLKYIPDKLQNHTNPPAFLDGFISFFDHFDTPQHVQALKPGDHTALGVIFFSAVILVVFAALGALLSYIQLYLAAFISQNLTARLRKKLFVHLERLSLDWHGQQKKGDIVQRVTGNIADIEKFVADGLIDLLSGILTIFGVATVMFYTSVPYTLLSIVIIPALAVLVFTYTTSIKKAAKKTSKSAGEVADVAVEDIGAITVLKAFSLEEREARRFNQYVNKNRQAGLRAGGLQAQFTPLVGVLVGLGTAIIIGVGAYVAAGNTFSFLFITIPASTIGIGTVVFFITLLGKLFQPMKDLSKLTNVATGASAGAERIQEVLDNAPEVSETGVLYSGPTRFRGDIDFENVVFGYTPEKLILKGINLRITVGKKVALVGLSGGGKTTLVKLIPRFYEVTQGSVKIDGVDTHMYPLAVLRRNVGMVLQESVLFEGTVLENLKIARPYASIEEVIEATKQAHIHDTIMSWPEGYGTLVRNQGKNFSGGQRQRLAIARAILSKAPILILDEPTAALDVEAEAEVMRALDQLVVGRTVLMISHRLSTLGKVDEIIVLKDGRIAEQGTYQDLKRKGGVFAALLKEQNRYNVDHVGESIVASKFANLPEDRAMRPVPPAPMRAPAAQPVPVGHQQVPLGNVPLPPGYAQNSGQQKQADMGNMPQPHAPSSRKAHVLIEINGRIVSDRQLDKPTLTVGRISGNDIQVLADRVSRFHARIRWENGSWLIEDADSLNGISYHGNRIDRHILMNGDKIMLGPKATLHYKAT